MGTLERAGRGECWLRRVKPWAAAAGMVLAALFIALVIDPQLLAAGPAAEQGSGKMQQGGGDHGQQGIKGAGARGGAQGVKDTILAEEEEDSDRPPWAGGNPTLNPHSGGGEGKPGAAGTKKGDDYGDLIVVVRDPLTGEPVVPVDEEGNPLPGEFLICLDVACTETVVSVDGEVPEGVTPVEVDFGRAAVARSPSKVTDKALTDALAKLDGADSISVDTSGRIVYVVDGVSSTIDSPLENLALYVDLMTGLASEMTTKTEEALGDLATLETAAALLAGVADKTGTISIDYVVYQNIITGVVKSGDYYDYSTFTYTRDYPESYSYFYTLDGGATVLTATLNINDYLEAVNGELFTTVTNEVTEEQTEVPYVGTLLFAAAADDALEIIELMHTQIYSEILPGTVEPATP